MSKKHRIGLKYCGGCTPQYDRVQAMTAIKQRLEDRVEFVSYEDREVEGILVVAGCPTACVDMTSFEGYPVWVVSGPPEAEDFMARMSDVEDGNGPEKGA